jgi:hypothetical protein
MTLLPDEEDTRKVQTAVTGAAGSDNPVFLPYDHGEFDLFMRGRSRDDFYCGILLGGCGKKLSAKRYTEKKCHFAHRPPVHCRRTANGESSADHLYIGQALTRWLAGQAQRQVKAVYRTVGDRPGGTVDFRLSGGRQLIRVQMARQGLQPWRREAEALAEKADHVEWIFGPDSMLAFDRVESHGYAIRVECRTVGITREVRIGTQLPGNEVEWTTLEKCSLTSQGIVTPSLVHTPHGIVPRGASTTATGLSFRLAGDTVAFTGAVPRDGITLPDGMKGRAYDADIQPLGSVAERARIVLPRTLTPPDPSRVYLLRDRVSLSPLADSAPKAPAWLLFASDVRRLDPQEAASWSELKPARPAHVTAAPSTPVTHQSAPMGPRLADPEIIDGFRAALERTAHARRWTTWEKLVRGIGAKPQQFTPEHRLRLLVALDFPHVKGKPVLSSLIRTEKGETPPFFAAVLIRLGWVPGLPANQVSGIADRERQLVYKGYGRDDDNGTNRLASAGPASAAAQAVRTETDPGSKPAGIATQTAVAAALGTLTGLRWRFDRARKDGDLAEARRAWQAAGQLYGTKLPPEIQAEHRPLLRDMSQWVHERENERTLAELRPLLDDLVQRQSTGTDDDLLVGLYRARDLKRKYHGKLPDDLQDAFLVCQERLAAVTAPGAEGARSEDAAAPRLGKNKLNELVIVVRSLLQDSARAQATITWSAIRNRLTVEVPHLHPDDQGQVLVLVDAATSPDEPLLSALVTTNQGDIHPLYRHVAFSLEREVPVQQDELHSRWQMDVLRLYSIWKHR